MSKTNKLKEKIKKILNDNGIETVNSDEMGWIPIEDEEALVVILGEDTFLMVINPYCDDGEGENEDNDGDDDD